MFEGCFFIVVRYNVVIGILNHSGLRSVGNMANPVDIKGVAGKGKGFVDEFREFITRGNVMDLAVGVIIGGAFQAIVKSLVDDVVMPVISFITGGIDFSNWFISLDGNEYKTLAQAQEAGAATLNYGTFLTAVINFILMAFVIFCLVKFLNAVSAKVKKEEEKVEEETEKECPYCLAMIPIGAKKCMHCTSELSD